jgi:O-methyltransferase
MYKKITNKIRFYCKKTFGTIIFSVNKLSFFPFYFSFKPDFVIKNRPDYKSIYRIWGQKLKYNNTGDYTRLYMMLFNLNLLKEKGIEGDIAEIGVYKGSSAKLFCTIFPEKKIYLFDTFEGFDNRDLLNEKAYTHKKHFKDTSVEGVKRYLNSEKAIFCKGYFPQTAINIEDTARFCLIHLDADLYNPTFEGLNFFYNKVNSGGLIIIHDYYSSLWPGVKNAVDEFFIDKPEHPVVIPDKSGTAIIVKQ